MESNSEVPDERNGDKRLNLERGMTFHSGSAFVDYVRKSAYQNNKHVVVRTRGGNNRTVVCSSSTCPFQVTAYKTSKNPPDATQPPWYISSVAPNHVDCTSNVMLTARQIAQLPSVVSALEANRRVEASFLQTQVQALHAVNLNGRSRTVYRAKQHACAALDNIELSSYKWLSSFLETLVSLNPGSASKCESDSEGRFQRCAIVFGASVAAQAGMQKVLGFDGDHFKNKLYSGIHLVLVGRDGNLNNVRIACALVPSESEGHCSWFFRTCMESGVVMTVPMLYDRGPGIVAAARSLGIQLRYCTLHIIRNINSKFPMLFRQEHHNLIWDIQGAFQASKYESGLAVLGITCGAQVQSYVADIDPVKWVVFTYIGKTMLYGWRTTNFVESEHNTSRVNGLRYMLPFPFVRAFVDFIREDFKEKSDRAKTWVEEGRKVTPGALMAYDEQLQRVGQYATNLVSDDIVHVFSTKYLPKVMRRVIVSKRDCSCGYLDQQGIPCRHFIAALASADNVHRVFEYFDPVYHVDVYVSAFSGRFFLPPIEEELHETSLLPPQERSTRPGPVVSRRIASAGEYDNSSHYRKRCSTCKRYGHNKRSCTGLPAAP
ncbi:hypothetical protein DYB36_007339 [Aphanomyces astaci]|uniref:SWIM-type domain-containing protein n=1 Tax=Aphanomyces astaci TaxID=112090 RepID=A0A397AEE0_APHAT|nr:hypothetical protein DYB36_007339 [Aphanomyces astaci]